MSYATIEKPVLKHESLAGTNDALEPRFFDRSSIPIILSPTDEKVDAEKWAKQNVDYIVEKLEEHGGILFRDFNLKTFLTFEKFVRSIEPELYGDYGDLPKKEGGEKTYQSTPYPNHKKILFHNESSHLSEWPRKQWFYCEKASSKGGATPIVDCRRVYRQLPSNILEKLEQKGLLYVRTFHKGLDVTWQEFFKTDSIEEMAKKCIAGGMEFEFLDLDVLQVRTKATAVIKHPITGEKSFFNQVQLHHSKWLDKDVRKSLIDMVGLDGLPRNVYYGDGSVISDEVMEAIGDAYEECAIRFQWQQGDVLMLDNMLVAHARDEFEGERKIVVAMGDMYKRNTVESA